MFRIFCSLLSILLLMSAFDVRAAPFDLKEVESIYVDDEMEALWSSLTDLHHPTAEDYQKIQNYLLYGRRPYLDVLFDYRHSVAGDPPVVDRSHAYWNRVLQRIMFVGANGETPIFKRLRLGGVSENDKSRCVVLYGSYNADTFDEKTGYAQRLLNIVDDLRREGYKGHVIYRLGGYPLVNLGSLRIANVPYSFKMLALIEASLLGYEDVVWLDCSTHPVNNLASFFKELHRTGLILCRGGSYENDIYNCRIIPDLAFQSAGLSIGDLAQIPHLTACIVGLSFSNPATHDLLKEWYRLTAMVYPAMTLYPEEFLLSVAAWRCGLQPTGMINAYMDTRSRTPKKPTKAKRPFWFDKG